jgi:iron complex transport system ATP-binding protein
MNSGKALFGVYGASFTYGTRKVLEEVSFELFAGEITSLIGPNGSGKSTLLKYAAGIIGDGEGTCAGAVRYRDDDFFSRSPAERAKCVAYVPQDMKAEFPITALEAVMMGRLCHDYGLFWRSGQADRDAAMWAMEECNCWALRERMLNTLSGGERQLVALARALAQGAKVLFLDEALSRMDLNHQALMGRLLKKLAGRDYAILLVSHDFNIASEWADNCLLLNKGQTIASGPVKEVLVSERIKALYPGAELIVGTNPVTGAPKIFFGK